MDSEVYFTLRQRTKSPAPSPHSHSLHTSMLDFDLRITVGYLPTIWGTSSKDCKREIGILRGRRTLSWLPPLPLTCTKFQLLSMCYFKGKENTLSKLLNIKLKRNSKSLRTKEVIHSFLNTELKRRSFWFLAMWPQSPSFPFP